MGSYPAVSVDWVAVSQIIGGVGQGIGAMAVAVAAVIGLGAWRKQLRGTRRHALAEECLSNAYQLQYMIQDLRRPFAWAAEMGQVVAQDGESEESRRARAHWGVVEVRFGAYAANYAAMVTSRFRLQTVFGKDIRDKFEDLLGSVTEVRNAAIQAVEASRQFDRLLEMAEKNVSHEPARDAAWKRLDALQRVVWANSSSEDELAARVDAYVLYLVAKLQREAGAE